VQCRPPDCPRARRADRTRARPPAALHTPTDDDDDDDGRRQRPFYSLAAYTMCRRRASNN